MRNACVVLVVEDETAVQTTLCATLTLAGFATRSADDIERALSILGSAHIDAAILDVRVPDSKGLQRTGLTLLSLLRTTREHRHTPVVIFTGAPLSDEDEALIRRYDAQLFYKPRPYRMIIETLQRMGVGAITGATTLTKHGRI